MVKESRIMKSSSFEYFVISVLRQIASSRNQDIVFDARIPVDMATSRTRGNQYFDAIAPNGFDGIQGPVIFEIKSLQQNLNYGRLLSALNRLCKLVVQSTFTEVTVILITNQIIDSSIDIEKEVRKTDSHQERINLQIWDQQVINKWVDDYPIDYSNAINFDASVEPKRKNVDITEADFDSKSQNNLLYIKNTIQKEENFAFVLGAGVSVDPGAKSWDKLLEYFTDELRQRGIIDNQESLKKKIGGSSIITAQLCKELYPNETDYYWAIHQGLYQGRKTIDPDFSLYHIARIASYCISKSHFRILTYNYDDYLESYLKSVHVEYNALYDSSSNVNDKLSIYHVHGYLPEVKYKSHLQEKHCKSIYLTEENYNQLYNQPYSWQISSQLSFFRENTCLFVGCSLADPNIRRLLEMTKKENRTHYAIMTTDGMVTNDLVKASNHFARIGIEVIWVNNYKEVAQRLSLLY